ncbi:hypothetical protein [Roseovarius sp. SYSU LYC5161]
MRVDVERARTLAGLQRRILTLDADPGVIADILGDVATLVAADCTGARF